MRRITLTADLPPVSTIGLGTAVFGSAVPTETAWAILDAYVAAGGDHLDSAHCYAGWLPGGDGASERCVGAWLRERGLVGRVLIATKGGHPHFDGVGAPRLHPEALAQDLRESLDRLGLPRVDLWWLHRDDPTVPVGEIVDACEGFRRAGLIRAYGASNWTAPRLAAATAYARTAGVAGFCADQAEWSLAERVGGGVPGCLAIDGDLLAWHRRERLPIVAYSSQAHGYFARAPESGPYATAANAARLMRCRDLALRRGIAPQHVALAWLTSQAVPTAALIGASRPEQVIDSCRAGALTLTPDEVRFLDPR